MFINPQQILAITNHMKIRGQGSCRGGVAYLSIWTSTRAASSGLDPKQVVEERTHVVMMEEESTGRVSDEEGKDWETWDMVRSYDQQLLHSLPLGENMAAHVLFQGHDSVTPHGLLELHGQPRPHCPHDGRSAPLLPHLHLLEIAMRWWCDIEHRPPSTGIGGSPSMGGLAETKQSLLDHQHTCQGPTTSDPHLHTHTHTHTCTHAHTHTCTHAHAHMHTHTHARTNTCMHAHTDTHP